MSKLIVQKVQTHTEGSIKEHQYGIGDVGLVLEILRNKLYRDPILAVVREYITNARDAHVEIGKADVPIVVTLPSINSLHFKVQDFGPGLSPERIEKIFCNYASSTKRDSDDQVGYFGIGSKSAFAYSDSFTIVSVFEGKMRTYSSYIDESRRGKISCLYEADSDLPNGTTIMVPVRRNDIDRFEDKLVEITEHWDVRPIVKIEDKNHNLKYKDYKTIFSGNGWKLVRSESYYNSPGAYAVMSGIPYQIDINNHFESHPFRNFFLYSNLRIDFQNSDLSLAASRDSLHYDSRTIKAIKEKFNFIISEINAKIAEQISSEPTYLDALLKFNNSLNGNSELSRVVSSLDYNNKNLLRSPNIALFGKKSRLTWYTKRVFNGFVDYKSKTTNYKTINNDGNFIDILNNSKSILVFNDAVSSNIKKYAVQIFKENSYIDTVVVLTISDTKEESLNNSYFWFAKEISELKISEISLDKSLKLFNRKKLNNKNNLFLYKFVNDSPRADHGKSTVEVSTDESLLYFIFDTKTNQAADIGHQVFEHISKYESIFGKKIYGVSASKLDKIPSNWKSLASALSEKYNATLRELSLSSTSEIYEYLDCKYVTATSKFNYKIYTLLNEQINKNNIIGNYLQLSKKVEDKIDKINESNIYILSECLNQSDYVKDNVSSTSLKDKLESLHDEIYKQYPLLKFIFRNSWDIESLEIHHMNKYISMIDC